MNLKEALRKKLTKSEIGVLPRAFDVIGSVAIIDIPRELRKKAKIIGAELLRFSNIQTVLRKEGKVKGRLRTRKLVHVAGKKTKETVHKESGCKLRLDVEKCYFSPRLSNDRIEVARQVKNGEKVLVLFSGVGPYPAIVAKNSKAKIIYAIELNKIASKYARENILLNKLENVAIMQGDVKKVLPLLSRKRLRFDRIVMTRPQLKEDFLKDTLKIAKKGTIIHFYDFLKEEDMPKAAFDKISAAVKAEAARKNSKINSWKLIRWKKALEIGPRKWRVRVDFFVF